MSQPLPPWHIQHTTSLYKVAAPKLVYPAGSRDEDINSRFLKRMDMYLFKNLNVRAVLIRSRPHPFTGHTRLVEYWAANGVPNFTFDTSKTFTMLQQIDDKGHSNFYNELCQILWHGGATSYGNIMRETYAVIYDWIPAEDFPDVEGLCEDDDGVTLRTVVRRSLRVVRLKHTQAIVERLYHKLDSATLVMRPNGMTGYFAQLKKFRTRMKAQGEQVSDKYLLRRIKIAVAPKHDSLCKALADLRTEAGKSGIPTPFDKVEDVLTDCFDFQISDADKKEKPKVPVNLATSDPLAGKRRPSDDKDDGGKRKRRKFPKGSCKNCPESTRHTTEYCYKTIRKRMGLPNGWQWCTKHKYGCHYEHLCKRHAPNFPPAPKVLPSAAAAPAQVAPVTPTNEQIRDSVVKLLGLSSAVVPYQQPSPPPAAAAPRVRIDKADQNFQTARSVPTHAATTGPPVDMILQQIVNLSPNDRLALIDRIQSVGL